jgi:hypothetical protein
MGHVRLGYVHVFAFLALLGALNASGQNSQQSVSEVTKSPRDTPRPTIHGDPSVQQSAATRAAPFSFKSPVMRRLWGNAARHTHTANAISNGSNLGISPFLTIPPMYGAGSFPFGLAIGDFNSDGNRDVVIGNNPPLLLLGNGDGTFQPATQMEELGSAPTGVAVADLNHDGRLDAIFAVAGGAVVYLGNGNGTFGSAINLSSGGANQNVTPRVLVADLNNDGSLDLILNTDAGVSVLLGNGAGGFQAAKISLGAVGFMSIADFNRDGHLDLATTNGFSTLSILLGNGDGTFAEKSTYPISGSQGFAAIASADFNQDGFPDVALPNGLLFLGNGDGTLRAQSTFPSAPLATVIVAIDVNGDGIVDLLTASSSSQCSESDFGNAGVSLGNGDGTFKPVTVFDSGGCNYGAFVSLVTGDLNNDGAPDVIVLSGERDNLARDSGVQISVLVNKGNGTFPAAELNISGGSGGIAVDDFNRDGKTDVAMADGSVYLGNGDGTLTFLASASLGGVAVATGDFNHDGKPDLASAVECAPAGCSSGGQLVFSLGNGNGTFQTLTALSSNGFYAESLAIGDFNGDGALDIAVLNNCIDVGCSSGGSISVFLGNGNGAFSFESTIGLPQLPSSGSFPVSVIAGDFNNDGILDLAAVGGLGENGGVGPGVVNILLGNGNGSFQTPLTFQNFSNVGAVALVARDFNQDGILDLGIAGGANCADCGGSGNILYGNGDGTFVAGPYINTDGGPPISIVASDFYGTGTLTAVLANRCWDILDCPGGSLMIQGTQNQTDAMLLFLAVGDFNNDGKPDLAGSLQYDAGASVLLNVGATPAATTTTVSPSALQSYSASQPATFTAQVHHTGPLVPTSNVSFFDNGVSIGSAPVDAAGKASFTVTSLAIGSHFIVPYYSGDNSFAPSNALGVHVTVVPSTTTTSLNTNVNPSYVNQSVTFTATVTSQGGAVLTGSVTFKQAKTTLAIEPLSNGRALYATTYTASGTRQVYATYSGDSSHQGSTSATLKQVTDKLPAITTTHVSTSGSASFVNRPVKLTAVTTSTFGPIPNGETVTFFDGVIQIGKTVTAGGVATFSTSSLTAKTHTIKASYSGDANLKTSFGTLQQVVILYPSTTTLKSSPNPSSKKQVVTLTATVQSTNPSGTTGTVTFKNGTQSLGSAKLTGVAASLSTSTLPAGTDPITAVYNGDTGTAKSASAVVTQEVQ